MLRDRLGQAPALGCEPLAGGAGVLERRLGVREVLDDLAVALGEPRARGIEPGGLIVDHAQALALAGLLRPEERLARAQRRQALARALALPARGAEPVGLAGSAVAAVPQRRLGGPELGPGEPPATDQQRRLDLPMTRAELAVALGLAGLLDQATLLLLEREQQVLDPDQVRLGRLQLELGLVPPRLQAADPGGFLEQPAAVGGLGLDQRADLALAYDRGAARARGGVREQELDVAGAQLLAVDPEDRADAAPDPPRQIELARLAEPRQRDLGRLDPQADLGQVERRPGAGAGEDHVVHLGAAQAARRGLAHHPAQRVDQVRLAAAVRTDDAGQPRLDRELGRMHERLEAGEAQPGDLQGLSPWHAVAWTDAITAPPRG